MLRSRRWIVKYYLPKFVQDKQIFLVLFNLVLRFFVNVEKYIPTKVTCKSVVSEHSCILLCLILHPRGEHWWNWVLIKLCKLSGSFYKNPHHLEDDFILMITHISLMICLYIQNWRKNDRMLILCLKCFLSKRFLSSLNINSYPWHFTNPEYLKGYC